MVCKALLLHTEPHKVLGKMRPLFFTIVVAILAMAASSSAVAEAERELQAFIPLGTSSDWYCKSGCGGAVDVSTDALPACSYTNAFPTPFAPPTGTKNYVVTPAFIVLQDDQFGSLRAAVVKDLQGTGAPQMAINWFMQGVMQGVLGYDLLFYSTVSFSVCDDTMQNRDYVANDRITFSYNAQKKQLRLDFSVKVLMNIITPATTPPAASGPAVPPHLLRTRGGGVRSNPPSPPAAPANPSERRPNPGPVILYADQVQSKLFKELSNAYWMTLTFNSCATRTLSSASFFVNALGTSAYRAPTSIAGRVLDFLQRSLLLKTGGKVNIVSSGTTGRASLVPVNPK